MSKDHQGADGFGIRRLRGGGGQVPKKGGRTEDKFLFSYTNFSFLENCLR